MRQFFVFLEAVGAILRRRSWGPFYSFAAIQTCAWHVAMVYFVRHSEHDAGTFMLAWLMFTAVCNVVAVVILVLTEVFV